MNLAIIFKNLQYYYAKAPKISFILHHSGNANPQKFPQQFCREGNGYILINKLSIVHKLGK